MTRRTVALYVALFLAVSVLAGGCKEERPRPALTAQDNALLRAKADEKIRIVIEENLPALFAAVVVFESNAFIYQSAMIDRAGLSVLNMSGNTAILLLNSPDIPPVLAERSVKKVYYLCRQGGLARLGDAFEMEMMRLFGEGKADDPVAFRIKFREPPDEKDKELLDAAGFKVISRKGLTWTVSGPLRNLARLMESDRIAFYDLAPARTGVTVIKEVPAVTESVEDIKERESREPPPKTGDRAIPSHRIIRDGQKPAPPANAGDNSVKY